MPLPEGYVDPIERKITWLEWFQTSDPFMKATLSGVAVGTTLGTGFCFITKKKRASYHVGWISYIASTAGFWLYFDTNNTRRLGKYDKK